MQSRWRRIGEKRNRRLKRDLDKIHDVWYRGYFFHGVVRGQLQKIRDRVFEASSMAIGKRGWMF